MNWTTDKPSVEGWYWWRNKHGGLKIVRYFRSKVFGWLIDDGRCPTEAHRWQDCEWFGPIPEPTEAASGRGAG